MTLIVAAIGGNALRTEDGVGAPSEWFDALTASLPPLLDLLAAGHGLVITHGNGPQVGEELLLARDLGAHVVFFLTGVDRVAVDFGKPGQRFLDRLTTVEARQLLAAGEFPPGSMGSKVEAAVEFVERGGERAVITSLDRIADAAAGRAGTTIVR